MQLQAILNIWRTGFNTPVCAHPQSYFELKAKNY